ncbi:MAG: HAD family hydrolase [Ottowia sp.]|nr:HAD family hydrolase [Ottowia sp.]
MISNPHPTHPRASEYAARIKLMIFDVDGVLTDGLVHLGERGELFKSFHILDGHGIKLLAQAGVVSAIITGRTSTMVAQRAVELGVTHLYQGVHNKLDAFAQLLTQTGLTAQACGHMGDDWPDMGLMMTVGFAACPAQAHSEVRSRSHYVAQARGGQGAVREVCDLILQAQGHYEKLLTQALGK